VESVAILLGQEKCSYSDFLLVILDDSSKQRQQFTRFFGVLFFDNLSAERPHQVLIEHARPLFGQSDCGFILRETTVSANRVNSV